MRNTFFIETVGLTKRFFENPFRNCRNFSITGDPHPNFWIWHYHLKERVFFT